jgi:hypothetical protein
MNHPRLQTDAQTFYREKFAELHKINPQRAEAIEDLPLGWSDKARLCHYELLEEAKPAKDYGTELLELTQAVQSLVKLQSIANQKLDSALTGQPIFGTI